MPPKKKGNKKAAVVENLENENAEIFMDKEEFLKDKLNDLTQEVENTKLSIKKLQAVNTSLVNDSTRIMAESHEFMGYIEKKNSKMENHILTLSKYNRFQIKQLHSQEENCRNIYNERRNVLQVLLNERQSYLADKQDKLASFDDLKKTKEENLKYIAELEREIRRTRTEFSSELSKLKKKLEFERCEYENESRKTLNEVMKTAYEEGVELIIKDAGLKKHENSRMRNQLKNIMKDIEVVKSEIKKMKMQNESLKKNKILNEKVLTIENQRRDEIEKLVQKGATKDALIDIT